jgi:hypothetical protein
MYRHWWLALAWWVALDLGTGRVTPLALVPGKVMVGVEMGKVW